MEIQAFDIDGEKAVSNAIMNLVNSYPGLVEGERFVFTNLNDTGLAMYPTAGAAVVSRIVDVTHHVKETCAYYFALLSRAYGLDLARRMDTKEWLDTLGRWIERQPVEIDGTAEQLKTYPDLSENRVIKRIERTSSSYVESIEEDKSENWAITLAPEYEREYEMP